MEIRDSKGRYLEKYKDIAGNRYFRLVALHRAEKTDKRNHVYWVCQCDCGNMITVRKDSLESGHAKSCGCYLKEMYDARRNSEKETLSKLYEAWVNMRSRCNSPSNVAYANYGGRGISVCKEWDTSYAAFKKWSLDNGFSDSLLGHQLSIDRIDVDGNYEPSNCRWTDSETQNYNKRCTVRVNVFGENLTLKEISEKYHIPLRVVRTRYNKHKFDGGLPEILTASVRRR